MDFRSLAFALSITLILLYAMFAIVVMRIGDDPAYRALKYGAMSIALGLGFNATQGLAPPWLPFVIGNSLVVMGFGWLFIGTRRLCGEDPSPIWVLIATLAMLAGGYYWGVHDPGLTGRLTVTTLLALAFAIPTAWTFLFDRRLRSLGRITLALGALEAISVVVVSVRLVCHWTLDIPSAHILEPHPLNLSLYTAMMLTYAMFAMALNLLVVTRLVNQVYELATHDPLTGALNRAGLQRSLQLSKRNFVGLLLMDLDHFKRVNDVHGHDVGDRLLQRFTEIVVAQIGPDDMLVRMGGEEFLVLVGRANPSTLAERIRRAFAQSCTDLGATVSIGVVALAERHLDLRSQLKAADEALYAAKRNGRDRVQVAELA